MKTINKYVLKNFFSVFFIYLTVIASLIFINYLYQILQSLLLHKPDINIVVNLFLFLLPSVFSLTIPITFLLAVMLTLSTLNEHKETLIFHTIGLNKFFYTKNIYLISIIFSLIMLYFNSYIVPRTYKNFKYIYFNQIITKPFINFCDNGVINLKDKRIFTKKVKNDKIEGVYINNYVNENTFQTIYAKEARILTDRCGNLIFQLLNGKITTIDTKNPSDLLHLVFNNYRFIVHKSEIVKFIPINKTFREMDNNELLVEFKNSNIEKYKKLVLSEYFLRHTLSFSIIFFTILGIFVALKIKNNSKPLSFTFTILIITLYYFMLSLSMTIIERVDTIPLSFSVIALVMQIPNITIFIIYLLLVVFYKILNI